MTREHGHLGTFYAENLPNKNKDSEPGFQSQSLQVVCSDINQRIEQSSYCMTSSIVSCVSV